MSLIPFHRGLIGTAIAFCFGYSAWEVVSFFRSGSPVSLAVAALFVVLGAGLAYYLARLGHFLGYGSREREEEP
jgi:hypothetical protein